MNVRTLIKKSKKEFNSLRNRISIAKAERENEQYKKDQLRIAEEKRIKLQQKQQRPSKIKRIAQQLQKTLKKPTSFNNQSKGINFGGEKKEFKL